MDARAKRAMIEFRVARDIYGERSTPENKFMMETAYMDMRKYHPNPHIYPLTVPEFCAARRIISSLKNSNK